MPDGTLTDEEVSRVDDPFEDEPGSAVSFADKAGGTVDAIAGLAGHRRSISTGRAAAPEAEGSFVAWGQMIPRFLRRERAAMLSAAQIDALDPAQAYARVADPRAPLAERREIARRTVQAHYRGTTGHVSQAVLGSAADNARMDVAVRMLAWHEMTGQGRADPEDFTARRSSHLYSEWVRNPHNERW